MPPALIALLATLAMATGPAAAESLTGRPAIIDGDTIEISGERIRLYGIDAPEPAQTCLRDGMVWPCGQAATFALAALIERHWVVCDGRVRDQCDRLVAICTMGGPKGINLNRQMVADGWALAERGQAPDYTDAEEAAAAAQRNLWQSEFQPPRQWRHTHRADMPVPQCERDQ
jgi:endonuclease YncB( thermonuclease family)